MSSYDDDGDRQASKGDDYGRKHKSRESNSERSREWNRDRHPRDYKERDVRDNRGRNRNSYGRSSYRDYERPRDYDHDRDRHHRHRSRSRSTEKYRKKSRSRSRSPSKSKRTSGFDMAPPVTSFLPVGAGQLAGVPQAMPGILQNMLPFGVTQVNPLGAFSLMPAQAMTQQATRHARRVYVGGLPPLANEQTIATFFSSVMAAIGVKLVWSDQIVRA